MNTPAEPAASPIDDMIDAVFTITCSTLPVDHAHALSTAIQAELPWFATDPRAGLHLIRAAESGGGWMRPEAPGTLLHLSRRTRLVLRLPEDRLDVITRLTGRTLDIGGHVLRVGPLSVRPLSRITTLLSHCVYLEQCNSEAEFLKMAAQALGPLGIKPGVMLCGRETPITTPQQLLATRSLMLAGLTPDQSLLLQQQGLGEARKLGCGLFIPHKSISDVRSISDI